MTLQSPNTEDLFSAATMLEEKMHALPDLRDVSSDLEIKNPQVNVEINRDKAHSIGLSAQAIEQALSLAYGSQQISTIYAPNNEYWVELELEPQYQADPAALNLLYVRSSKGQLVPLNTVAKLTRTLGPLSINHSGQLPSVTISFDVAPGVSLGKALADVKNLADNTLPAEYHRELFRRGRGLPEFAGQSRHAAGDGHSRHLSRARHPLRKLHPSDHDSLGFAGGGLRRPRHPDDLSHGTRSARLRRHHHAGRPGQEKRHHDDRLRARRAAHRGQERGRGDFRRMRSSAFARS